MTLYSYKLSRFNAVIIYLHLGQKFYWFSWIIHQKFLFFSLNNNFSLILHLKYFGLIYVLGAQNF